MFKFSSHKIAPNTPIFNLRSLASKKSFKIFIEFSINIVSEFKMNKNSLTVVENTGTVRNYYIHRGWVTDGQNKLAKEKLLQAQLKRMR